MPHIVSSILTNLSESEIEALRVQLFSKAVCEETTGCLIFPSRKKRPTYNLLGYSVGASQVAWFLYTGKWPTLWILHKCDNSRCLRYDHLYQGTPSDNAKDRVNPTRERKQSPVLDWTNLPMEYS
jgi:hypothetical protein